jgi:hypothetical protein
MTDPSTPVRHVSASARDLGERCGALGRHPTATRHADLNVV